MSKKRLIENVTVILTCFSHGLACLQHMNNSFLTYQGKYSAEGVIYLEFLILWSTNHKPKCYPKWKRKRNMGLSTRRKQFHAFACFLRKSISCLGTVCTTETLLQGSCALRGWLNQRQRNTVPFLAKNQLGTLNHPSRSRVSDGKWTWLSWQAVSPAAKQQALYADAARGGDIFPCAVCIPNRASWPDAARAPTPAVSTCPPTPPQETPHY